MKKYLALMGVCLAVSVCLNVNLRWNSIDQEKFGITMENIEALASGENPAILCNLSGSLDCPTSSIKVKYILQS